jgi:hypothetical protein
VEEADVSAAFAGRFDEHIRRFHGRRVQRGERNAFALHQWPALWPSDVRSLVAALSAIR